MRLYAQRSAAPAPWVWDSLQIAIVQHYFPYQTVENWPLVITSPTEGYYDWDTTKVPDGYYDVFLADDLVPPDYPTDPTCGYAAETFLRVNNSGTMTTRHAGTQDLQCACRCDSVPTGSNTSPLTGAQSWSVPVSSWGYKGTTYGFSLNYNSHGLTDPQAPAEPNFAGLSERNSHWWQPYAQWIDTWTDENGAMWAVWHDGESYLSFQQSNGSFQSPDSFHTLTAGGGTASTTTTCAGSGETLSVPYSYFVLTDGDGTEYDFNSQPPAGQNDLYWVTGDCTALPHYLLTRIKDRWGRTLNITWDNEPVNGGTEPRVTAVMDAGDASIGQNPRGVTLGYNNGLLASVQDPQGRTHTLSYSPVPDENGVNRQKLTGIAVYGPGSPNRVVYHWQFAYSLDPTTNNLAYGGTYTGDLVIQKTEPDGLVHSYRYEPVTLTGSPYTRPTADDWEGRVTQISWQDGSEGGQTVTYAITRTKNSDSQATMTYPSMADLPVAVQYNYSGIDLASVTDLAAMRTWSYQWDGHHNLLTVRSPLEQATPNPLVQYAPTVDSSGHVTQTQEQVLRDDGTLGDPVTTLFNAFNLPTQITATSRDGMHDQVSQFQYDGGTLSVGNLTKILAAVGTAIQQETDITYGGTDGKWGLPDTVTNAVGGVSTFGYDHATGLLLTSASPVNLLVPVGHVDRAASVTTLAYNSDELPSLVTDAMGHQYSLAYNAQSAGSGNLVITETSVNGGTTGDGSSRQIIVDPEGRPLQATDEKGVVTLWTYNPVGKVKSITRAAGTPDQRVSLFNYDCRGDLYRIAPPSGGAGSIFFTYRRFTLDASNNPVWDGTYEGQVTRIIYPDHTSEYFGYNDAGELAWHRKQDGRVVRLQRDAQHRVKEIDYPASGGSAAFSVTTQFDEFGRPVSSTDQTGTTTAVYDQLDRPTMVTPPLPQAPLTYGYTPDPTNQRWITTVTANGIGSYQYQEDTKGRLSDLVNPFSQTFHLEYDRDGKNTLLTQPNGVQELRSYTVRDWLSGIQIKEQNTSVLDTFNYYYTDGNGVYDSTGHLQREVDGANKTHAFFYDRLYELVQETHPDFGSIGYGYDLNGNRTSKTTSAGTDYYGVDAANKLLWVNRGTNAPPTHLQANPYTLFTYDACGRTTYRERQFDGGWHRDFSFLWDGDDRLRSVKNGNDAWLSASYAGDGTRVSKTDFFTGTHNYSWGPGGLLADSSGSTTYTPGFGQRQGTTDRFFQTDWLGSTRYLSDSTGNSFPKAVRYSAFGERTYNTGSDPDDFAPFQFAGGAGYQSEHATATEPGVGLQLLGARYYDPAVGRFISQDPVGLSDYGYCDNDPVGALDPSGLDPTFWSMWPGYAAEEYGFWGQQTLRTVGWLGSLPGKALWGLFERGVHQTTFRPDMHTFQNGNHQAYPGLPEAGRQVNRGVNQMGEMIAGQAVMGAIGAYGEGALGDACETGAGSHPPYEDLADRIGRGHAFPKHVVGAGDFSHLPIETEDDFVLHIQRGLEGHTDTKPLSFGRRAWYHRNMRMVVVYEPLHDDWGTAWEGSLEDFRELQ